jgi:flagellar motor protein MotB
MAKQDNSPPPEPGPPKDGWIISFSDCMMNLLCFFVLLVSFSSFDPEAQGRIQGAFTALSNPSLFNRRTDPTDAVVPPQDRPFDPTPEGAEKPTDQAPQPIRKKHDEFVPNIDAIHDQVTIRVPARRLFWGSGDVLTQQGRTNLRLIASYMKLLPVRAVVQAGAPSGGPSDLGLRRAWAVVSCLNSQGQIPRDRLCINADPGGDAVVEIRLLRRGAVR